MYFAGEKVGQLSSTVEIKGGFFDFYISTGNIFVLLTFSLSIGLIIFLIDRRIIKPLLNRLAIEIRDAEKAKLVKKVAHDIKSPVTALEVIINDEQELSPDLREFGGMALERIKEISKGLLEDCMSSKLCSINEIIEKTIAQKNIEFSGKGKPSFSVEIPTEEIYANINPTEFQSILSNLINNSVEAMDYIPKKKISIRLEEKNKKSFIYVSDNGTGIPKKLLKKLGKLSVSKGKQDHHQGGAGIALVTANRFIKEWGGSLKFKNLMSGGAQVEIMLPQ